MFKNKDKHSPSPLNPEYAPAMSDIMKINELRK